MPRRRILERRVLGLTTSSLPDDPYLALFVDPVGEEEFLAFR
jgi:hypothetical protein